MLLTPVRDFFKEQNELKQRALTEGRLDSPEAKQPWVYTYALRGVNFLIAGHSLEYFEFYRHADTGFMYETSNRDPRGPGISGTQFQPACHESGPWQGAPGCVSVVIGKPPGISPEFSRVDRHF